MLLWARRPEKSLSGQNKLQDPSTSLNGPAEPRGRVSNLQLPPLTEVAQGLLLISVGLPFEG